MTWDHGMRLRPSAAEETKECQTPNGIRKRLQEFSRENPLVRHVFDASRYHGFSGEDTMTVLAYEALVRLEQYEMAALRELMIRQTSIVIPMPACDEAKPK